MKSRPLPAGRAPQRWLAAAALLAWVALPTAAGAQSDEGNWYDGPQRAANVAFDVVLLRPSAAITVAGGAVLFVPAALMTSPGGRDTIQEAWELFVLLPGQNLWERPLGEL